jgi:hypothetical protein
MIDQIKALLPFLAGMGFLPKVIVTLIVFCIVVLFLFALWWPDQINQSQKELELKTQTTIKSNQPLRTEKQKPLNRDTPATESLNISLKEYFEKTHSFGDRFHERDSFHRDNKGKSVNWQGYIELVQSYGNNVAATISVSPGSGDTTHVVFEPGYRETLFSYRKGDLVKFRGIIYSGPITKPEVNGYDLERIKN